jgi:flagellar motor protein MotB
LKKHLSKNDAVWQKEMKFVRCGSYTTQIFRSRTMNRLWGLSLFGVTCLLCAYGRASAEPASHLPSAGLFPAKWQVPVTPAGLTDLKVNALKTTADKVFIGTQKGLLIWHKTSGQSTLLDQAAGLPAAEVLSLLVDGDQLWIGTKKGLAVWVADRLSTVLPGQAVSALAINALAHKDGKLYLGTSAGVFEYDTVQNRLTPWEALQGLEIAQLFYAEPGLLIVTSTGEVDLYSPASSHLAKLDLDTKVSSNPVVALDASGDCLWFATNGGGLIGYNFMRQERTSLSASAQKDNFLSAVASDGRYVWLGSFSGLACYDVREDKWYSHADEVFTRFAISALAVEGDTLWVGTAGGGALYGPIPAPFVQSVCPKRYVGKENFTFAVRAQGPEPLTAAIAYRPADGSKPWSHKLASLQKSQADYQGQVDFNQLKDRTYQIKISVQDGRRQINEERFSVVKETKPMLITFNYNSLRPGGTHIEGKYQPPTIERIEISPGNLPAVLDRKTQTFSAEVKLAKTDKEIQFTTYDGTGRSKLMVFPVKINPDPKLLVSPSQVQFLPGTEVVRFNFNPQSLGELDVWDLNIWDKNEKLIRHFSDKSDLPQAVSWDGKDETGQPVAGNQLFYYSLKVKEKNGFEMTTPKQVLKTQLVAPAAAAQSAVIKISKPILFNSGKSRIPPQSAAVFEEIMKVYRQHPGCMLAIEGHADDRPIHGGRFKSNQDLSEARARAVAKRLKSDYHINKQRITTVGYADSRPADTNKNRKGRAKNRRVEIYMIEK